MRLYPLLLLPLAACGSLSMAAEPRVLVAPYLAVYQLRGELAMQNDPGTGPVDNQSQRLRDLGQGQHQEDIGVRVDFGDGFGGLRVDYLHLAMDPAGDGVLTDDFGQLLAGDVVSSSAKLDEVRALYLVPVWSERANLYQRPFDFKLALGGGLAHRDLGLHVVTPGGSRAQSLHIDDDGVGCAGARFRAGWRSVQWDVDYTIAPGTSFGGDFDGVQHDLETRFTYTVPFQDVSLFAGYRYCKLPVDGTEGGLGFDGDLVVEGYFFGVTVSF